MVENKDKAISVHIKTIHSLRSELQVLKVSAEAANNGGDEV